MVNAADGLKSFGGHDRRSALSANGKIFAHSHVLWESNVLSATLPFGIESPVKKARSVSNGNKNIQSKQPYPNTCPFQITKVRDLDFLQNDENIIYIYI